MGAGQSVSETAAVTKIQAVQRGKSARTQLARERSVGKLRAFLDEPEQTTPRRRTWSCLRRKRKIAEPISGGRGVVA